MPGFFISDGSTTNAGLSPGKLLTDIVKIGLQRINVKTIANIFILFSDLSILSLLLWLFLKGMTLI